MNIDGQAAERREDNIRRNGEVLASLGLLYQNLKTISCFWNSYNQRRYQNLIIKLAH